MDAGYAGQSAKTRQIYHDRPATARSARLVGLPWQSVRTTAVPGSVQVGLQSELGEANPNPAPAPAAPARQVIGVRGAATRHAASRRVTPRHAVANGV